MTKESSALTRITLLLLVMCTFANGKGYAQGDVDLIGFKGGYKALSRLCEQNLDGAARLLVNDYSRGYFVSLTIPAGADTVTDIAFLTATPPDMAGQITWALKGTNGQWMRQGKVRKLLIPIFFCQNTPPNDSLFSQLLITNNVGFSVSQYPDQWPEAAEGVWIHPICPLVAGGTPRQAPAPAYTAPATAPGTTAPGYGAPATAAPGYGAPATAAPAGTAMTTPAQSAPANGTQAYGTPTQAYGNPAYGPPTGPVFDTISASGVFMTKDHFDKGLVAYGNTFSVEEKGLLSWFPIDYAAYGTVRVRTSPVNKDYQEFPVGAIFGFKSNNIAYVYLKSAKEYLAVIAKAPPFYLMMDERKQTGYNGNANLDGIFMYARTLDGPVKEFTRKNIENDFGSNANMMSDLQILRKELNKHSVSMTRGDFEACRELAKDYLAKWATAQ
ncbi:hypothetical protein [Dinghuibacter silviterrae]|uniref:Uncharacterized protein n=1 Tax=Dinghuibacter silviterrae TaxID=1539049 RepID=A0A4R8DVW3_9BACT|nr:hypothetical protein [Dinghuibacter silviterrae]TDX01615.1 hypothetical protein EDB95_2656 [Dinghuibacter silviterrae]